MDSQAVFKLVDLFRGLNAEQIQHIQAIAHKETFAESATVFNQGSNGDAMYVIAQGQVEVKVRMSGGSTYPAIYLGMGQIFGEMALIDEGKRSASIIAVEDETTLFKISTAEFLDLCHAHTDIGFLMMRNIAQDLSFKLRHRDFDPSIS